MRARSKTKSNRSKFQYVSRTARGGGERRRRGSEFNGEAADETLRRTDDEELVVGGGVRERFVEEIADADEHFPLRGSEVHERQRLVDLQIEPRAERRRHRAAIG